MLVVGLATESSSSHTSKIERQQELCFCFAPGGKEDRDDEVCKHTRAVIVADAYRMQRGVYDTTSSNVLATVSNGSEYRTIRVLNLVLLIFDLREPTGITREIWSMRNLAGVMS